MMLMPIKAKERRKAVSKDETIEQNYPILIQQLKTKMKTNYNELKAKQKKKKKKT